MTRKEFKNFHFEEGMRVIYSKKEYYLAQVDFNEALIAFKVKGEVVWVRCENCEVIEVEEALESDFYWVPEPIAGSVCGYGLFRAWLINNYQWIPIENKWADMFVEDPYEPLALFSTKKLYKIWKNQL